MNTEGCECWVVRRGWRCIECVIGGWWWWLVDSLVSTVWDVSRPGRTEQSLSQAGLTFAALNILESGQAGREESEGCLGPRHHLLRFGPDAVHHACCSGWCCNRHLKLSVLSATTTMYSLRWRDRQTEKDVLRMSRLVQSLVLCVLTHTPLHSTSTPAILSGCDPTDWSCMLAWQAGRMVGPPITIISDHANIVIEKWFIQSEYNSVTDTLSYNQVFVGP